MHRVVPTHDSESVVAALKAGAELAFVVAATSPRVTRTLRAWAAKQAPRASLTITAAAGLASALAAQACAGVVVVRTIDDRFARTERATRRRETELFCGPILPVAADPAETVAAAQALLAARVPQHPIPDLATIVAEAQAQLDLAAVAPGRTALQARAVVADELRRISNDYRYSTMILLRGLVHVLSKHFFRGVVAVGLEQVEGLPADARIIYLPCHRSHLDYLLIPYLLQELGQACPLIAAGDNLDFSPVGRILRRGCAFFIRRRFSRDSGYKAICSHYLGALLRRRIALAFFPEGGRSRDGRLRPMKVGLLGMCVAEALADACGGPVYFVPLTISYERCPEARSLARQNLGRAKRQESLLRLTKSLKILTAEHGRAFLRFGRPLGLHEVASAASGDPRDVAVSIARSVAGTLNAQAVVTLPALVAAVVIGRAERVSLAELVTITGALAAYCERLVAQAGWTCRLAPSSATSWVFHRGLARVAELGPASAPSVADVTRAAALLELSVGPAGVAPADGLLAAKLDWQHGTIAHLLVPLGWVMRALAAGPVARAELVAGLQVLRERPDSQMHWPERTPSAVLVDAAVAWLVEQRAAVDTGQDIAPGPGVAAWRWLGAWHRACTPESAAAPRVALEAHAGPQA